MNVTQAIDRKVDGMLCHVRTCSLDKHLGISNFDRVFVSNRVAFDQYGHLLQCEFSGIRRLIAVFHYASNPGDWRLAGAGVLQILSLTLREQMPLDELLAQIDADKNTSEVHNHVTIRLTLGHDQSVI